MGLVLSRLKSNTSVTSVVLQQHMILKRMQEKKTETFNKEYYRVISLSLVRV